MIRSIAGSFAALLLACCSNGSSSQDAEELTQNATFDELFELGFEEGKGEGSAAAAVDNHPARTGITSPARRAIERSSDRTREIEAMVAAGLTENLSARFLTPNPEEFVRSGGTREVYWRELGARNLPGDTVAGATALLYAVAWEISNGRRLSQSDHAAILAQANESLDGDISASAGTKELQERADTALTIAGLWLEEARVRASDPEQAREFSDAVRHDMLRMSGTDMRLRKVTAEGFTAL